MRLPRTFQIPSGAACLAALFVVLLGAPAATVTAQAPGAIDGVVLEADTDRPVAGARVILEDGRVTESDPDGRFRIPALPFGPHRFRVEALGYRPQDGAVEIGPDGARVEVVLIRQPLMGREVVATGTPIRGVAPYQPSQAFDSDQLDVRSANSFGEMLDGEPGLAMRSFGPAAGRPVIRGLDGDRVAVLEGGQRMGDMSETAHDHAVAMEPLLAERVEVVRGPASLLYGSSALGGVVNLLRRDVPAEWGPGWSGTAATQGATVNRLGAAAASAVYGSDRWAATVRGSFRDNRDFRAPGSPSGTLESTHSRLRTGGAGAAWQSGSVRFGGSVDVHDHVYGVPEELDDPDEDVEIRSERQRITGLLDWHRSDGFVETVEVRFAGARYLQQEVERERHPDGSIDEEVEHDFGRYTIDGTVTATHASLGPFDGGAFGASVLASTLAARGAEEFHPDGRGLSVALFAFEQVSLSERIALQTGLRLEYGSTVASENAFFPGFSARREAATVSGSIGLNAAPREGVRIGAQLSRAHRTPLLEQMYSQGPHLGAGRFEIGEPELRNEVGHGLDVFARYDGIRLSGELALFHNRIDDYVFPRPTGAMDADSGLPVVRWTATAARFIGGEVVAAALLPRHFHLRATADYVRAGQRGAEGEPLPFIPPARASLGVTHDPGRWWIGGRGRLIARQDRVPAVQDPTDGYALFDFQGGLRLGDRREHTLTLRIDNAFDEVYRDHLSRVDDRRFPMPGRNVTAVYRWRF